MLAHQLKNSVCTFQNAHLFLFVPHYFIWIFITRINLKIVGHNFKTPHKTQSHHWKNIWIILSNNSHCNCLLATISSLFSLTTTHCTHPTKVTQHTVTHLRSKFLNHTNRLKSHLLLCQSPFQAKKRHCNECVQYIVIDHDPNPKHYCCLSMILFAGFVLYMYVFHIWIDSSWIS